MGLFWRFAAVKCRDSDCDDEEFLLGDAEASGDSDGSLPSVYHGQDIYNAAHYLRSILAHTQCGMPSPPKPSDLTEECASRLVPNCLYNFLAWFMRGDDDLSDSLQSGRVTVHDADTHRRILSLAQDLIYCGSKAGILTPKHIMLPMTVKSLTGSAQLVTILNRFGHGVSLTKLSEVDTAMAEKLLALDDGTAFDPFVYITAGIFCVSMLGTIMIFWKRPEQAVALRTAQTELLFSELKSVAWVLRLTLMSVRPCQMIRFTPVSFPLLGLQVLLSLLVELLVNVDHYMYQPLPLLSL